MQEYLLPNANPVTIKSMDMSAGMRKVAAENERWLQRIAGLQAIVTNCKEWLASADSACWEQLQQMRQRLNSANMLEGSVKLDDELRKTQADFVCPC